MAYVRKRGNQLAIVHGARDPETKKVGQQILFTLYSRPEALAAIGKDSGLIRHLLQERHPHLRFDWKQLRAGIEEHLGALPPTWDYEAPRLEASFAADLGRFARQLVLADPRRIAASPAQLEEHQRRLAYLRELIDWRLKTPAVRPSPWRAADQFGWYASALGNEVPADVEERAAAAFQRGDYPQAIAAFAVLTEAFPDYADGHNYLGLIALERLDPSAAVRHFQRTMEVGRRLFPKRISKGRWWNDLATRPFMRGLRNLALALNQAGHWEEALTASAQLEDTCGDVINAAAYRARAHLNLKQWQPALEAALAIHQLSPGESLVAALAAFELGRPEDARGLFLHAALNVPRTVALVLGVRGPALVAGDVAEVDDHHGGLHDVRSLAGFLAKQSGASRRFFLGLWKSAAVAGVRAELAAAAARARSRAKGADRTAFTRMIELQSFEFARAKMGGSPGPLPAPGARTRARNETLH